MEQLVALVHQVLQEAQVLQALKAERAQPVQGVRWVSRAGLVLKVRLATPDCQAEAELLDPRVSQGNQVHWDHEVSLDHQDHKE